MCQEGGLFWYRRMYWEELGSSSWACWACTSRGKSKKTYTSLDWVRNHWLKCKYNETGEAGLPAAKVKMIMKTTTNTLKELAHIKFVEEYNVGFFLMKLNIGAITP
jgi:hypothetical protein